MRGRGGMWREEEPWGEALMQLECSSDIFCLVYGFKVFVEMRERRWGNGLEACEREK